MPLCLLPYHKELPALPGEQPWLDKTPLPALDRPHSQFVESLRSLRTSLLFSRSGGPPRSLLMTSPLTGEGKSYLSWNLAIVFAQQGKRVLLCDANLRHPTLHRNLEVDAHMGLSTVLANHATDHGESLMIPVIEVPGLHLMPAGPLPPYPAELLASRRMADLVKSWESQYDIVLLDAPPVLQFTDSVVLSSMVNSVLLVARHGRTPLAALETSYRMLEEVQSSGARRINIVVNGVRDQLEDAFVSYIQPEREAVKA